MSGHDGFKLECIGTIGGLKSIIMPETQLGRPPVIACVVVLGYHQPGDDGGGLFVWMPTSNEDYFVEIDPGTPQQQFQQVDGITVKPTNRAGPGRWKRLFSGPVDIRWLGAQKNGDNTTAIQAAIDSLYPIYIPSSGSTSQTTYNVGQSPCGTTGNKMYSTYLSSTNPAYGEKATSSNGLTQGPITQVVLPSVAASNNAFNVGQQQNAPTGVIGVKRVDSNNNTKYTFGGANGTFTSSSTGWTQLCNNVAFPSFSFYGWQNITLTDNSNTYTMQVGDVLLITWSGTGSNEIAVSNSAAGTYGAAILLSSGSLTTVSGSDLG